MMAFHMSSFCLHPFTAQSNVENMPPQTPKFPPVTGARALMTETAPTRRSPYQVNVSVSKMHRGRLNARVVSFVHLLCHAKWSHRQHPSRMRYRSRRELPMDCGL